MQKETKFAIAREVAKIVLKNLIEDVDHLSISETLDTELSGLEEEEFGAILKLVESMIKVASHEFYFAEYRIREDGTVASPDESGPVSFD